MSSPRVVTFVDAVLSGDALAADIDDWVEQWHAAPSGDPVADLELHEFLGIPWDSYKLWTKHPESLRFVIVARRHRVPVAAVVKQLEAAGAAARSVQPGEAEALLNWLEEHGHVQRVDRHY